ncbi:MAG: hypothetical protein HUJ29_04565 [Gammaproteobacteria bacterium]|nr:hypothetical protein [Gammaproteobacteria bacterium]
MPAEMGLAILSGALGMAFSNIDKISEFKGAGFEAKMKDQIQAVIDKETEPEPIYTKSDKLELVASIPIGAKKIINALQHPQYTWRSIHGLIKDTGLQRSELSNEMAWLVENEYAKHSLGKPGSIWTLTKKGRQLSALIDFSEIK